MTTTTQADRTQNIYEGQRVIGFTYFTKGGFWRAYSFATRIGSGPFFEYAAAVDSIEVDEARHGVRATLAVRAQRRAR